jgi:hypothetical protein
VYNRIIMTTCGPQTFGADPANIKWNVVRGDTAILLVQFLEEDEETFRDTSGWDFVATAYDPISGNTDELETEDGEGYVEITAPAFVTEGWGSGSGGRVAELKFDLQVITEDDVTWTPVIGTISVIGDITGGNL